MHKVLEISGTVYPIRDSPFRCDVRTILSSTTPPLFAAEELNSGTPRITADLDDAKRRVSPSRDLPTLRSDMVLGSYGPAGSIAAFLNESMLGETMIGTDIEFAL